MADNRVKVQELIASELMAMALPEMMLVEQAIEGLQNYKMGIAKELPIGAIMAVLIHEKNRGKSFSEIVTTLERQANQFNFGAGVFSEDSEN